MKNQETKTEYLDYVESKFIECFVKKGYIEEKPVNITSQIDKTVDFIGSKISPLKKYIVEEDFGDIGRFLIQNSMKLKSLKYLKTDIPQEFGCYYKCMGILSKPKLEKVVLDTFDYFTNKNYLNISPEDICIKISSTDTDLMDAISNVDSRIKRSVDTCDISHYRHNYGMNEERITGRDFNIGIRKKDTNEYFSCATFVIMEKENDKIAIDMGIGNCSLSMCKFGTNSTVSSSRMADIIDINNLETEKFADALIAVSVLLKEDITNHPSKHFRKKFRQYLNALNYWNNKLCYTDEQITYFIIQYLNNEYHESFDADKDDYKRVLIRHKKNLRG